MSIKKTVNDNHVHFDFDGDRELTCSILDLPDEMIQRLALHGLSQKVGDSYAANEGMADAHSKAEAVWDSLKANQWNAGRTGGGGDLTEALMNVTGQDRETVSTKLAGMGADEKKAIRKNAQVAAELARIKAERAAQRAASSGDSVEALFQ